MESLPAELIEVARRVRRVAVITGAGISSESGIPTFRGTGGLWRDFRVEELATPGAFARDPRLVWEWYDWRRQICRQAEPNAAHSIVAEMERHYPEFLLITQNVDNLHRRAGSTRLIEIHGNIFRARCMRTGQSFDLPEEALTEIPPPSPFAPDAIARPDIVWFGETYDEAQLARALDFLSQAELIVVVGTSGMVPMPVYLARHGVEHGAIVVDVNPDRSALTELAHHYLQGRAGEILPAFWSHMQR
jgi:NAD-dependent deacetylase